MSTHPQRDSALAPLPAPPPLGSGDALFLDFDGTLVELAARPDAVVVGTHLPALLDALAERLGGAVALITGRPLSEVDALLGSLRLRGAGLHGAELRYAFGQGPALVAAPGIAGLAQTLGERFAGDARVVVEDKGAVVALHFRQAPERAHECAAVMQHLASGRPGIEVLQGNQVVEARAEGSNKGGAVRALLRAAPFAGRMPVVVGDDRTDEDAFGAAAELGGHGVKVGAGATTARFRCASVGAVHAWLRAGAA